MTSSSPPPSSLPLSSPLPRPLRPNAKLRVHLHLARTLTDRALGYVEIGARAILSVGTRLRAASAPGVVPVTGTRMSSRRRSDGAGDVLESGPERGATKIEVSRLKKFRPQVRLWRSSRGAVGAWHRPRQRRARGQRAAITSNIRPEGPCLLVFLEPRLSHGGRSDGRSGSPGVAGDSARVRDRPDGVRPLPPRRRARTSRA